MKKSILILFSLFSFSIAFAQSGYNLEFSQAILVEGSSLSVPSGKVWKVVSVQRNNASNYTCSIIINGSEIFVGGGKAHGQSNSNSYAKTSFSETFPIWLPTGTTIAAGTDVQFVSVVEFNLISN
jgi:hypothetical protein